MNTSEVLNRAADLLQKRGLTGGSGWFPELHAPDAPLCVEGAFRAIAGRRDALAIASLGAYLDDRFPEYTNSISGHVIPWSWNDRMLSAGRASEVIEVLRACAVIEASRERETAEVSS